MTDITDRLLNAGDRDAVSDAIAEIEALRADSAAAWDKCEERRLETVELLTVMKLAVELSKKHKGFDLWGMEPFTAAIAKMEGRT